MKYYLDNSYQQKVVIQFLKNERLKKKISISELAKTLGVSKQFLAEVETFGRKANPELIESLFLYFDIDFSTDLVFCDEIINYYNQIIKCYLNINKKERMQIYKKVIESKCQYSYVYPLFWLICFINAVLDNNFDNIDEIIKLCDANFELFTHSQKSDYLYFKGMYFHRDKKETLQGKEFYISSLSYEHGEISGMIFHQLGTIYLKENNIHLAYDMFIKSKDKLEEYHNYKMTYFPLSSMALLNMQLRLVSRAENLYLDVITICKQFNRKTEEKIAYFNLAHGMMWNKEYKKAIDYIQPCIEQDFQLDASYYVLAWSYYYLNECKMATYYLDKINELDNKTNVEIQVYTTALRYLINGNHNQYYNKLVKFYNYLQSENSKINTYSIDKMVLLERLIEYCDKHRLFEEGFNYSKDLLKIVNSSK